MFNRKKYYQEYYKKNKQKLDIQNKKYRINNQIHVKNHKQLYYIKNKKYIIITTKKYYNKNKKKIFDNHTQYVKNRYKKDINFRLSQILRSRIKNSIKNNIKSSTTEELLGAPIEKVKKHLEKGFPKGTNWKDYGYYGYHIDHIKPLASFNLSNFNQQHKAFHYTNLQLLWWKNNLSKGDKYNE